MSAWQQFGTACCIGIPLLVYWWKLTLWDAQRRKLNMSQENDTV